MKLTNCYSEEEKALKEIELTGLDDKELVELAQSIKKWYELGPLEDENIVIDAMHQISIELGKRI